MAFPQTIQDVRVDFRFDGSTWVDQTAYVQVLDENGGIQITSGRQDWAGRVDPATCTMRIDNRDGRFSPRNPLGPYYGQIGRNTPVRVSVMTGTPYLELTGSTSDLASTPDNAALDITGDLDVRIDLELTNWFQGLTNQSADALEFVGKFQSGQKSWLIGINDNLLFLEHSSDGTNSKLSQAGAQFSPSPHGRLAVRVTLDVDNGAGGYTTTFYTAPTMDGPWTQLGGPHIGPATSSIFNSTSPLNIGNASNFVFEQAVGKVLKLEVRNGINGTVVANPDFTAQAVGTTSFADAAGRTWTVSGGASITNRNVRFVGEVPSWPLDQDASGSDIYVELEAAGIMRRMKANQSGLQSTLRRRIPTYSPVAYWPMEEGESAELANSPVRGVGPLRMDPASWGANETLVSSEALPEVDSSGARLCQMAGPIPGFTSTGEWAVHWMYRDDTVNTTTYTFMRFETTGSIRQWLLQWRNNLTTILMLDDEGAVIQTDTWATGTDLYNQWIHVYFEATQDGSDVDYVVAWQDVGGDVGLINGAVTGQTIGRPTKVASPTGGYAADLSGMAIGHISVWDSKADAINAYRNAVDAWKGETTFDRLERVMREEGLPISLLALDTDTHTVGEQRAQQLFEVLQDAADVDGGILFEHREDLRLAYRSRVSLYNQEPTVTLAYASDLMPGLKPQDDDQGTVNDVTVTRTSAGSYRLEETEGPMAATDYPDGIGRYPEEFTLKLASDGQAPDQAGWLLHLGTVDEARYPRVTVWLQAAPSLIPQVSSLVIGDRMVITDPPGKFQYDDIDLIVQGYTEFINQYRWEFDFVCTPASPWDVGHAGTDGAAADDERFSWADGTDSIVGNSVSDTETVLPVATPTGLPWTSDPFDSPYLLTVSGETVRVDAPGGVCNNNPFFTSNTTDWTAQSCSIARSTAVVHPHPDAVASLLVTPNGVTASGGALCTQTAVGTIIPGAQYVASMWVYSPAGWSDLRPAVNWNNSAGTFISSSFGSGFAVPAGEWTFLTQTFTAPATASRGVMRAHHASTPAASDIYYVWAPRLTRLRASEVYDDFGRTSTDTWDVSDSGTAWTNTGGAAADYDVLSGYGRHINPAVSTGHHSTDSGGRGTVDIYCTMTVAATSTGGSQFCGILARYTDINNLYEARVEYATTGAMTLSIRKRVASVETQLGTFTSPLVNIPCRVRFKLNGTTLKAKIWDPTNGREPSGWPIVVTDSSFSNGQAGVKSVRAAANTNANAEFRFDSFDMINRQEFVVTRSYNGVVKAHGLDPVALRHPAIVAL